ncbi:hypothetical protein PGIGA_G00067650 [Pangasianodon gigas]|uniref:Uncharacterized protein n=1 Tax=Pangasianodon gigas TaxID=30993 RepID=A0ACC5X7E1_PANGG|nr:hypothetical protein [Pangasianodon gigas]
MICEFWLGELNLSYIIREISRRSSMVVVTGRKNETRLIYNLNQKNRRESKIKRPERGNKVVMANSHQAGSYQMTATNQGG